MLIPDTILTAEALLTTLQVFFLLIAQFLSFQNVFEGLSLQSSNVERVVREELPYLALEKAMMWLAEEGVDRQKAHAVIRTTALNAKEQQATQPVNMEQMLKDSFFDSVSLFPICFG